ncbi:hypothetical protein A3752_17260, partial [Oleiphilus sp. HI0081]
ETLMEWSEPARQHILSIEDAGYPSLLKEVFCPPPMIYLKGCLESLLLPALAVVGSRKPSMAGKQHAYSFAYELSLQGQNVVSGLALGVDTLAHRGALEASGITCAVLGTGLDLVYPRQNQKLAEQIMDRGVLVSEMALGSLPVPANFPRRNRLISGLSQGSLIVEAGLKSGSLITANYAIEQNREVYVIPGPIDSEVAAGCNDLIKQGAQLVTCVEDILAFPCRDSCMTVASSANNSKRESPIGRSTSAIVGKAEGHAAETQLSHELLPDEGKLLPLIDFQCTSFDVLASESQLEAGVLLQNLVSLELKGLISNVPGGYQRVKSVNSAQ